MAERKLKLNLRAPIISLFLKVIIFWVLLEIINASRSGWWEALFFAYSIFVYFRYLRTGPANPFFTYFSFVLISAGMMLQNIDMTLSLIISVFLSALFFIVLGVRSFLFHKPKAFFSLFYYFVVFLVASYFSATLFSVQFFAQILVIFIFFYFTFKEYFSYMLEGFDKRKRVYSLVVAFGMTQIFWVSSLLSIGYLNAASLVLVSVIAVSDIFMNLFSGKFDRRLILRDVIFFAAFSILILILPVFIG